MPDFVPSPVHIRAIPSEDLDHVLTQTGALWEEARGRSFFITGGTGFFGMWLLESFTHINDALGLGMRATVLTRDAVAFGRKAPHLTKRSDLALVVGDVRDFVFPSGKFEYIIHAAAEVNSTLNQEAPHEILDAIIGGNRRVLEHAARCGVHKLLFTSSGAVYGKQPSDLTHVPEDYAGAPDPLLISSAYGEGKRVAEHMCVVHANQHGYEIKIARCFTFVGPHLPLDAHFAIGNFIRNAMRGDPIIISGDGTPMRSYLYASDLAIWLWTLLFKAPSARAYNVGSAQDMSIRSLAESVAVELHSRAPVQVAITPEPFASVSRYVPCVNRANHELGLAMRIPFPDAIRRTAAWHHA